MGVYGLFVTAVVLFHIFSELVYTIGTLRASRSIHASLVKSLLGSTFRRVGFYLYYVRHG